jgi:hypothetical protein
MTGSSSAQAAFAIASTVQAAKTIGQRRRMRTSSKSQLLD